VLAEEEPDDRPVPSLGLGDPDAAALLIAATRAVLVAESERDVVTAVARFGLGLGGRMVAADDDAGSALPLDIAFGTSRPVLFDADPLSVARMRLQQFLPLLLEDARTAIVRLRRLDDLQSAAAADAEPRDRGVDRGDEPNP
jgi:hypothetical protein